MNKAEIKRVVGYVRVSTIEQADSGAGLEAQRGAIDAEIKRKGWQLLTVFEDHVSGKSLNGRHELKKALIKLKARQADGLVVAKLDRLSRSVVDFGQMLATSRKQDWALIALDFDLDTSTPAGKMVANVMMSVAEWEREVIGQRTREGLAAKRASGTLHGPIGRPRSIVPELERRILRMRRRGKSFQAIADQLSADGLTTPTGRATWSWGTVMRVVRRNSTELVQHRTRA